jgi:predicted membrane-bound spermidine synthase
MMPSPPLAESIRKSLADRIASLLLPIVFFLSGSAALLYQLAWQRSLLLIYGSNIESVAVVVSAFLVGLGIGGISGGAISTQKKLPLIALFSAAEMLIALYGIFSLQLFQIVGARTLQAPALVTGLATFGLVVVPTFFMGATLPLLVTDRVRLTGEVGLSVGLLYFVNTLGAAFGAFLAVFATLHWFGLSGTTKTAASLNAIAALLALGAWTLQKVPR